jgi:ferrochelatase
VETLVELDRDYARIAAAAGVETYIRVPALGVDAGFIEGLAELVDGALGVLGVRPGAGRCGGVGSERCPLTQASRAA